MSTLLSQSFCTLPRPAACSLREALLESLLRDAVYSNLDAAQTTSDAMNTLLTELWACGGLATGNTAVAHRLTAAVLKALAAVETARRAVTHCNTLVGPRSGR